MQPAHHLDTLEVPRARPPRPHLQDFTELRLQLRWGMRLVPLVVVKLLKRARLLQGQSVGGLALALSICSLIGPSRMDGARQPPDHESLNTC